MMAAPSQQNGRTGRADNKVVQPIQPAAKSPQARGRMARSKGQSGERELAALLTELTGRTITRQVRQHAGDSDLIGLEYWSLECKRHAAVTPGKIDSWWWQCVEQSRASKKLPVLFFRADRGAWRCVWNADLHRRPMPQPLCSDYEATLEASPEVWWQLCKDMTNRRP